MENTVLPRIPVSTYRLQFNSSFQFKAAAGIIPYLHKLGISDIYSSPYLNAKKGSLHGYDIVDHSSLNPETGSEGEYAELTDELKRHGMGQIYDIVPNHMCITSRENSWWMNLLENGPSSEYSAFFDIDWAPVKEELKEKVLIPVLGDQYGKILEGQELRLVFEEGAFFICYHEHTFPVRPATYAGILELRIEEFKNQFAENAPHLIELLSIITSIKHLPPYTEKDAEKIAERSREKEIIKKRLWNLCNESHEFKIFINENVNIFNGNKGEPRSFDLLDGLISSQVYRLSYWRVAMEEINYRRFFDINELAAIRMENPDVFAKAHELIFRLMREKKITGLRVDHPDGLYNPSEYFQKLQMNCFLQMQLGDAVTSAESADAAEQILTEYNKIISSEPFYKPFYIVGEKILIKGERMPEDWRIFSTTGYVFMNSLNGLFVETSSAKLFDEIYLRFIKKKLNYQDIVYEKKKLIMQVAMSSEINTLGHYLNRISEKDRHTRDFTLKSLANSIVEAIAFFPVYRTYTNHSGVNDRDRRYIEAAISKAKRNNPAISESIFDFLKDVLLLNFPENFSDADKEEWIDFVMRFQQITGPVMAKGVEDTAFYVYNRLASLNEVGGSPDRFGISIEAFHGQNIERGKFWPHALITTSTHDSKRSEDVRARINVLSEMPDEWRGHLMRWNRFNKKYKKKTADNQFIPDRNEEYLLYQTLIGAWPFEPMNDLEYEPFKKRIKDYMLKASKEAKVNTSWINPNSVYEEGLSYFIDEIMRRSNENLFISDFLPFQKMISHYGAFNSLSQTLLKIVSPGLPDFYQGSEIWDLSLVDPDNRRPVEYEKRIKMLNELARREKEEPLSELARRLTINKNDGMVKMFLIYKALNFRRENRDVFERGEYIPIEAIGERLGNICAFARRHNGKDVVVIAPMFYTKLSAADDSPPFGREIWKESFISVPFASAEAKYINIFTGKTAEIIERQGSSALSLADVISDFPVALLENVV